MKRVLDSDSQEYFIEAEKSDEDEHGQSPTTIQKIRKPKCTFWKLNTCMFCFPSIGPRGT